MGDVGPARWEHYVLLRDDGLRDFWGEHLHGSRRAVLVILGRGFDPRTPLGLRMLMQGGGDGPRDVIWRRTSAVAAPQPHSISPGGFPVWRDGWPK